MKKITIITVCYNSANTIRETIESVLFQDYPNVEYIIYDGLSSDGTVEIVKSYGSRISKFVSEKDSGLYDAMNKAIDLATGDVVGILNSDDLYNNEYVLSSVMREFENKQTECVFGDLIYFKTSDPTKIIRHYKGKDFARNKVKIGILPPHPTFFVKKEIYDRHGKFDLQFKFASDFDLMVRFLYVHSITFSYLPMRIVKMRLGGISTGNLKRIIEINKEDLRSCRKNGVPTNFIFFHIKYLFKMLHIRDVFGLMGNKKVNLTFNVVK